MSIHAANLKPSLTIQRRFKAPARLVYQAWTDPEHMLRWWGTKDTKKLRAEADVRVGGRFPHPVNRRREHVDPISYRAGLRQTIGQRGG